MKNIFDKNQKLRIFYEKYKKAFRLGGPMPKFLIFGDTIIAHHTRRSSGTAYRSCYVNIDVISCIEATHCGADINYIEVKYKPI